MSTFITLLFVYTQFSCLCNCWVFLVFVDEFSFRLSIFCHLCCSWVCILYFWYIWFGFGWACVNCYCLFIGYGMCIVFGSADFVWRKQGNTQNLQNQKKNIGHRSHTTSVSRISQTIINNTLSCNMWQNIRKTSKSPTDARNV